jgi:hypothetical protein
VDRRILNSLRHPVFVLLITFVLLGGAGGGCGSSSPLLPEDAEGRDSTGRDSSAEPVFGGDSTEAMAASYKVVTGLSAEESVLGRWGPGEE